MDLSAYQRALRPAPPDRPWVLANFIVTADGAAEWEHRSAPLSGEADRALFHALRALADVVLVGGGTARGEHYGPVRLDDGQKAERVARGQQPVPAIAVVTRQADLDFSSRLFTQAETPTLVVTTETTQVPPPAARLAAGAGLEVDLSLALATLHSRGVRVVLTEGGPWLFGELLALGLVDELCLTIAPKLAGAERRRMVGGPPLDALVELDLADHQSADGFLFCRYVRRPA